MRLPRLGSGGEKIMENFLAPRHRIVYDHCEMQTQPRYRIKSQSEIWFEGLSFKNQEVIKYFSNTFGRGLSRPRTALVAEFYRLHGPSLPVDIPLADKYEFAYDNFESFKMHAADRMVPVDDGEGGAK